MPFYKSGTFNPSELVGLIPRPDHIGYSHAAQRQRVDPRIITDVN